MDDIPDKKTKPHTAKIGTFDFGPRPDPEATQIMLNLKEMFLEEQWLEEEEEEAAKGFWARLWARLTRRLNHRGGE